MVAPLTDLQKKDALKWREKAQKAFEELKVAMTKVSVLALLNFSQPFGLETNALGIGVQAVLIQIGRPIAYFSKALSPKAWQSAVYEWD